MLYGTTLVTRRLSRHLRALVPLPLSDVNHRYLVVWQGFAGTPWRSFTPAKLRAFLMERITDGFAFPLNPKWVLADDGWFDLYAAMARSPAAAAALDCWLPPHSGLRERIDAVHAAYPDGFVRVGDGSDPSGHAEMTDMALAELALRRHHALRRAKIKLKAALFWLKIGRQATAKRLAREAEAAGHPVVLEGKATNDAEEAVTVARDGGIASTGDEHDEPTPFEKLWMSVRW